MAVVSSEAAEAMADAQADAGAEEADADVVAVGAEEHEKFEAEARAAAPDARQEEEEPMWLKDAAATLAATPGPAPPPPPTDVLAFLETLTPAPVPPPPIGLPKELHTGLSLDGQPTAVQLWGRAAPSIPSVERNLAWEAAMQTRQRSPSGESALCDVGLSAPPSPAHSYRRSGS